MLYFNVTLIIVNNSIADNNSSNNNNSCTLLLAILLIADKAISVKKNACLQLCMCAT